MREFTRLAGFKRFLGSLQNHCRFVEHQLKDVRRAGNKVIRTEVTTGQLFDGWEKYADLLFLACLTILGIEAFTGHKQSPAK